MSTGFGSRLTNVGNVENKGLEVALNTLNMDGEFKWASDFTFSINRNEVLNLGGLNKELFKINLPMDYILDLLMLVKV